MGDVMVESTKKYYSPVQVLENHRQFHKKNGTRLLEMDFELAVDLLKASGLK